MPIGTLVIAGVCFLLAGALHVVGVAAGDGIDRRAMLDEASHAMDVFDQSDFNV